MIRLAFFLLLGSLAALVIGGCAAPSKRLTFPVAPICSGSDGRVYDTDADGRPDFSIGPGPHGNLDVLSFDDNEDGSPDRVYRMSDYADGEVPHLIILFDSIPFQPVLDRWRRAGWTFFAPPQKVIPPFPTMSPVIFSRMLGAPPQMGAINQYFDRAADERVDRIRQRAAGDGNPWERRLTYRMDYWDNGMAFLEPRDWFHAELAQAKAAFDASPDRVTIVYLASTACMLSKYGRAGLEECLDGLEQLTLQVLLERRGAVKISVTADHGHSLAIGKRIDVPDILKSAGFRPVSHLRGDDESSSRSRDVVVELDGLVNYVGMHTCSPADVALALVMRPEFSLAMYLSGDRVVVRSSAGSACVEFRQGRYRYRAIDADVLGYAPVIEQLTRGGSADADGFIGPEAWLAATADHHWPDAPVRLWNAFHGMVVNTPDVMAVTSRGYYVGLAWMSWFIDMASTHGGLDQDDSATFLLTTTGRGHGPLRTDALMRMIEPTYDPARLRR